MGRATAVAVVKQHPKASILVLEKEQDLARRHRLFPAPIALDVWPLIVPDPRKRHASQTSESLSFNTNV